MTFVSNHIDRNCGKVTEQRQTLSLGIRNPQASHTGSKQGSRKKQLEENGKSFGLFGIEIRNKQQNIIYRKFLLKSINTYFWHFQELSDHSDSEGGQLE